ncbi:hypothetical protein KY346_06510 [Candidatus Woesearchaeota archaeon]|nr:hypothetical protein [Candidatus Woesearchaeota archaeon]
MNLMDWGECKRQFIRTVTPDKEKINSILDTVSKRRKFIDSQQVNKDNVSFIIEGYYEIIKELLVALLLKHGLKSKNHQCLISYFYRKHSDREFEANLISEMSYLRNRLNYYGEAVDISFYEKNKEEIMKIIQFLMSLVEE